MGGMVTCRARARVGLLMVGDAAKHSCLVRVPPVSASAGLAPITTRSRMQHCQQPAARPRDAMYHRVRSKVTQSGPQCCMHPQCSGTDMLPRAPLPLQPWPACRAPARAGLVAQQGGSGGKVLRLGLKCAPAGAAAEAAVAAAQPQQELRWGQARGSQFVPWLRTAAGCVCTAARRRPIQGGP